MKRILARLEPNPIIVKEIRSRMRGPRPFITLTIILLVMAGILAAILQIILATASYSTVLSPQVGQVMFAALAFLILFMVCAITPAVTAGAISSEKEKQTYEMLMATPLSPTRVLWGKLISAMSYVLLLLFASIPLASLVFIFGGVAPADMIRALIVLVCVALTIGVLGLFMSALFGRTGLATVASFITVVILLIGPLFLAILIGVLTQAEPPRWILAPSPISALSGALAPSINSSSGFEIFWVLSGIWDMGVNPISQTDIPRPIYHYSLPLYLGFSLVLFMITTRLVQPSRRWRLGRKQVITAIAVVILFLMLIVGGFLASAGRYEWALDRPTRTPTAMIPGIMPGPVMAEPALVTPTPLEINPNEPSQIRPTPEPTIDSTPSGNLGLNTLASAGLPNDRKTCILNQRNGSWHTTGVKWTS